MENRPIKDGESEQTDSDFPFKELAFEAAQFFENGEFAESLSRIARLHEHRPTDTRFIHNAAVVEFYMNGTKNVDEFKKKLSTVCSRVIILLFAA